MLLIAFVIVNCFLFQITELVFHIYRVCWEENWSYRPVEINNYFSGMLNPVYAMLLFYFFRIK